jgi:hypothetical protein
VPKVGVWDWFGICHETAIDEPMGQSDEWIADAYGLTFGVTRGEEST